MTCFSFKPVCSLIESKLISSAQAKSITLFNTFHLTFFFKPDEENLYTFFSLHIYALKPDFK